MFSVAWLKQARKVTTDVITARRFGILCIMITLIQNVSSGIYTRQTIPKFLPTPTNVTVHKGELAELMCHIQNLGPKMVVWRKASEENPLTLGLQTFTPEVGISVNHAKIDKTESKWNLLIKNVQPRHAGVYVCGISSTGTYTHYVALNVLKTPVLQKPELSITGTQYVNQYHDIHLVCNATGIKRAPEEVDWFLNGNRIVPTQPHWYGRIEILKHRPIPGRSFISELIIHLSTMQDQGNYVCRSSDLNVNSMNVHILNDTDVSQFLTTTAGEETGKFPRAPGEEGESMKTVETGRNQAAMYNLNPCLIMLTLLSMLIPTNVLLVHTNTCDCYV